MQIIPFDRYNNSNIISTLTISVILILIISNFTLRTFVPNIIINIASIVLIGLIQYYYGYKYGVVFFIAQLLMLSNFTYGNNQCGLYNSTTFLALIILLFSNRNWKISSNIKNFSMIILLFFVNLLGYIFNPHGITSSIQGVSTFSSFIIIYLLLSKIEFNYKDLSFIFKGLLITQVFSFFINIFKLLRIYDSVLPMLGGESRWGSMTQAGVMGNSELFAEINLISLIFVTVVMFSNELKRRFEFSLKSLVFFLIILSVNIFLTRSRSVLILYILSAFYLAIMANKYLLLNRGNIKNIVALSIGFVFFYILFGSLIDTTYSFSEFSDLNDFKFNREQIIEGYGLNRSNVFPIALARLAEKPWIVGYGWSNTENNRLAWGISNLPDIADYHSLYYSMPMIFGWVGTLIIIFILLKTAFGLFSSKKRNFDTTALLLRQGLFFLIIVIIIIDQFKISAMRDPNYFMIFWIFLGLANSLSSGRFTLKSPVSNTASLK